jgi:hypothetical protein
MTLLIIGTVKERSGDELKRLPGGHHHRAPSQIKVVRFQGVHELPAIPVYRVELSGTPVAFFHSHQYESRLAWCGCHVSTEGGGVADW